MHRTIFGFEPTYNPNIENQLQIDAIMLTETIPGAIIGGSYCIDPANAHDIDIVVPSWTPLPEGFNVTSRNNPEYNRSDISCLEATARDITGKLNMVFVTGPYLAAYYGAIYHMQRNPKEFIGNRPARVEIHSKYEQKIRELMEGI